jgi:hypothetical protein
MYHEELHVTQKLPVIRIMIEENPYLSRKKTAQTLSLHDDIVKRLIAEELNLRRVSLVGYSYPHHQSKTGKGQDFAEIVRVISRREKVSRRMAEWIEGVARSQ